MSVSIPVNGSTELKRGALGVGFIIFFVVSAASPLSVIAGGFPIGIMLGNGAGTPALLLLALCWRCLPITFSRSRCTACSAESSVAPWQVCLAWYCRGGLTR